MTSDLHVQYGAGWKAAPGWLNYDASPSLWLERAPILGKLLKVNGERFPKDVQFGDIVAGLPVPNGSAAAVYASHVLEHLSYEDFWKALQNTYQLLAPGGVFRLIVPDLQSRTRRYLDRATQNDPEAAPRFIRETYLGREARPRTLPQIIRGALGNASHLWMWDEASMTAALHRVGFVQVRRCSLGDADDPAFALVEAADRFTDTETGDLEIAMEAKKPSDPLMGQI